jgi:hypothetical protein
MKRCIIIICFYLPLIVFGQTGEWQTLFNGKDLTGWKQLNGRAKYEVRNGMIIGTTVPDEPNSFLATEKEYGDFVLELELMVDSTMNSGIQFRSASKSEFKNGRVHGYQMEIDPSSRKWSGGIYEEAGRLWLYTLEYNPSAKVAFRNGKWNKYRIECIGNQVRTWVNDLPAAYLIDDRNVKGFIALQVHSIGKGVQPGKQVMWRNIRIKTTNLVPTSTGNIYVVNMQPNHVSEVEKKNGVWLLWDGKTSNGWRSAFKTSFPDSIWAIQDGILSVQSSGGGESRNGGDIVTTDEFSAFELQFEFRLTEGANSGVKYFVTEKEQTRGSAIGLEYQLLDNEKHADAKLGTGGNRTLASLYDLIPSIKTNQPYPAITDWNRGMVRVYPDNHAEHYLNGFKVVEYQRGTQMFKALVAYSKYAIWPDFGMAPKGRILLQEHGSRVDFRSIKIKLL